MPSWGIGQLTDDHLRAIGRVAAEWAILEQRINTVFCWALDLPDVKGQIIAAKVRRADAILDLVIKAQQERMDDRQIEALRDWKHQIQLAHEERDRICHAVWWGRMDEGETDNAEAHPSKPGRKPVPYTSLEINKIADRIMTTQLAFVRAARELFPGR